jgi:hypothetical protein
VQNWEFWFPGFPVLVYYKVGMGLRACAVTKLHS